MLNIIFAVIFVGIATLLCYAATKPNTFRITRKIVINAAPEKIFPLIDTLGNWAGWSPWEKLDPNMQKRFSGPAGGKGAIYEWEGNNKVGAGRMEIVESVPSSKIVIKLDFLKPFVGHNLAEFELVPQGNGTEISWSMYGPQRFLMKVMGVLMNCDKMVSAQFDQGLSQMKRLAEA